EARQAALEVAPVQNVELGERDAPGADLLHARLVFAPPGVGEGEPVKLVAEGGEDFFGLARDRGAPVEQRPEHVEEEGLDAADGGVLGHAPAPSMALKRGRN